MLRLLRRRPRPAASLLLVLAPLGCSSLADSEAAGTRGDETGDTTLTGDETGDDGSGDTGETTDGGEPDLPDDGGLTDDSADPLPPGTCAIDAADPIELLVGDGDTRALPPMVRSAVLDEGSLPDLALATRPFLNYYGFDYAPGTEEALAVDVDLWKIKEGAAGRFRLQIGVTTEAWSIDDRPPLNLTIVADNTASLDGEGFILLQTALDQVVTHLKQGDTLSLVAVQEEGAAVLLEGHGITGENDSTLADALFGLQPAVEEPEDGLQSVLLTAYDLAETHWEAESLNRVLVLSDGRSSFGDAIDTAADLSEGLDLDAIHTASIGIGLQQGATLEEMEALSDAGRGPSSWVGDEDDVWATLGGGFMRHVAVAADEVEVSVTLPAGLRFADDQMMGLVPDEAEGEPVRLGPQDTLVLHHVVETCDENGDIPEGPIGVSVSWHRPGVVEPQNAGVELAVDEADAELDPSANLSKGAAVVAYAHALQVLAREGEDATLIVLEALAELEAAKSLAPQDPELDEMIAVLEALVYES